MKFTRLAAKQVLAMRQRGELDAAGRIMSLESVRAELAERQRRSRPPCSSGSPGKKISGQRFKVIFSRRRQPVIAHLTGTFLGNFPNFTATASRRAGGHARSVFSVNSYLGCGVGKSLPPVSLGYRLAHRKGSLNAENAVRTTGLPIAGRKPRGVIFD